jgi:hypothetical protein
VRGVNSTRKYRNVRAVDAMRAANSVIVLFKPRVLQAVVTTVPKQSQTLDRYQ